MIDRNMADFMARSGVTERDTPILEMQELIRSTLVDTAKGNINRELSGAAAVGASPPSPSALSSSTSPMDMLVLSMRIASNTKGLSGLQRREYVRSMLTDFKTPMSDVALRLMDARVPELVMEWAKHKNPVAKKIFEHRDAKIALAVADVALQTGCCGLKSLFQRIKCCARPKKDTE
jgi:hypothetical protein